MTVREKIVAAAFNEFHLKGFADCSVQDIVVAAGVPKGSFYNYFKSKELLGIEIVGLWLGNVLAALSAAKGETPLKRLKAYFVVADWVSGQGKFRRGCLMGNFAAEVSGAHPALQKALSKAFDEWTKALAGLLEEARKVGEVNKKHDPEQLARIIINSWEGATLRLKVDQSQRSIDDFYAFLFESIG